MSKVEVDYSKLTCFVVTPIGGDESSIRRATDGLIDSVIKPILCEAGFSENNIFIPHRMPKPGSITGQVIDKIMNCDLVVVNLTGLNANVMYELAIRHASKKPLIILCEKDGTQLPFDIIDQRTIFYKNDMLGVTELNDALKNMIPVALEEESHDNPIYRVISDNLLKQDTDATIPVSQVLDRINSLEGIINSLINSIHKDNIQETKSFFKKPFLTESGEEIYGSITVVPSKNNRLVQGMMISDKSLNNEKKS